MASTTDNLEDENLTVTSEKDDGTTEVGNVGALVENVETISLEENGSLTKFGGIKGKNDEILSEKSNLSSEASAASTQPQRGGRKGKKKQKWKQLDMSTIATPTASEPKNPQRSQWGEQNPRPESGYHRESNQNQFSRPEQRSSRPQEYRQKPSGYQEYRPTERGSNIALSKALVTLLRHGKPHDIKLDGAGFVNVKEVVEHPRFKQFHCTEKDIYNIVNADNKKRYETQGKVGENFQVRATQGHSLQLDVEQSGLTPITDPNAHSVIVHGTYQENWRKIKKEGLKRMGRTYVHFAIGLIGQTHVTSGMRSTTEIIIHLDLARAMADGLQFYESKNGVVLCSGNKDGLVSAKYFKKVEKYDYTSQLFKDIEYKFEG